MIKKTAIGLFVISLLFAGEGLPVLTLPQLAQEGYLPYAGTQKEKGLHFSYASWYYDSDYSTITAYYGNNSFGFRGLVSGNIEIRGERPETDPIGSTAYYNTLLFAGRTWSLSPSFSLNTRLKLVSERLFYASSWGAATDLDLVYNLRAALRVLAGVENVGRMSPLSNEHTRLPSRYYLGADYNISSFIISLRAGTCNDGLLFLRAGLAYTHPLFDVYYSFDNIQNVQHVGADLKWNKLRIGYGQFFHYRGLGYPMMFSLGFNF